MVSAPQDSILEMQHAAAGIKLLENAACDFIPLRFGLGRSNKKHERNKNYPAHKKMKILPLGSQSRRLHVHRIADSGYPPVHNFVLYASSFKREKFAGNGSIIYQTFQS